jgi:prevent-host-death family protein
MAMARVPATEFKARCLELMDRVAEKRVTYVITKRGRAVARLVPIERKPGEPLFGRMRGMAEEVGDIVAPVMPDWSAAVLEEWDELNRPARRRASRRGGRARRTPRRTR